MKGIHKCLERNLDLTEKSPGLYRGRMLSGEIKPQVVPYIN